MDENQTQEPVEQPVETPQEPVAEPEVVGPSEQPVEEAVEVVTEEPVVEAAPEPEPEFVPTDEGFISEYQALCDKFGRSLNVKPVFVQNGDTWTVSIESVVTPLVPQE